MHCMQVASHNTHHTTICVAANPTSIKVYACSGVKCGSDLDVGLN